MDNVLSVQISDYSDTINALWVLLGKDCIDYIDYSMLELLHERGEVDNPYRNAN